MQVALVGDDEYIIIPEGYFHAVFTVGQSGRPSLSRLLMCPVVTGITFARDEGRDKEVLDVASWNVERIQSLLSKRLTLSGRESLASELRDLSRQVEVVQKVPHAKDEIHYAYERLRQKISRTIGSVQKEIERVKEPVRKKARWK